MVAKKRTSTVNSDFLTVDQVKSVGIALRECAKDAHKYNVLDASPDVANHLIELGQVNLVYIVEYRGIKIPHVFNGKEIEFEKPFNPFGDRLYIAEIVSELEKGIPVSPCSNFNQAVDLLGYYLGGFLFRSLNKTDANLMRSFVIENLINILKVNIPELKLYRENGLEVSLQNIERLITLYAKYREEFFEDWEAFPRDVKEKKQTTKKIRPSFIQGRTKEI